MTQKCIHKQARRQVRSMEMFIAILVYGSKSKAEKLPFVLQQISAPIEDHYYT